MAPCPTRRIRDAVRATLDDVRARGDTAVREANERVGGGRRDGRLVLDPDDLRRRQGRPDAGRPARPRPGDRPCPPLRGDPAAGIDPHHDRPRHRDRAPLDPAGLGRRLRPGRVRPVPVVARDDRRPGPGRRRRARRRRLAGRPRRRETPRAARGGRPARGRRLRRGRWRPGRRRPGVRPAGDRDLAGRPDRRPRATPGSRPRRSRSAATSASTCRPAPPRASSSPTPPADPVVVAADLLTQAEHGPDSPAILVTTDAAFADAVERQVADRLASAARRDILERALRDARADRAGAGRSMPPSTSSTPTRRSTSRSTSSRSSRSSPGCATPARCSSARGRRSPPATTRRAPTTSSRPAVSRGAPAACPWTPIGKFVQVQRVTREGLAAIRDTVGTLAEAEGLLAHRDAVEIRFAEDQR